MFARYWYPGRIKIRYDFWMFGERPFGRDLDTEICLSRRFHGIPPSLLWLTGYVYASKSQRLVYTKRVPTVSNKLLIKWPPVGCGSARCKRLVAAWGAIWWQSFSSISRGILLQMMTLSLARGVGRELPQHQLGHPAVNGGPRLGQQMATNWQRGYAAHDCSIQKGWAARYHTTHKAKDSQQHSTHTLVDTKGSTECILHLLHIIEFQIPHNYHTQCP